MKTSSKKTSKRKSDPPREGNPGEARFWIYVFDGVDSGERVGWTNAKARAFAWTRAFARGGWTFDRTTRGKYSSRGVAI